MKGALLIEVHSWRGVTKDADLFAYELHLGFVTIYVGRNLLSDALRELRRKLEELRTTIARGQ